MQWYLSLNRSTKPISNVYYSDPFKNIDFGDDQITKIEHEPSNTELNDVLLLMVYKSFVLIIMWHSSKKANHLEILNINDSKKPVLEYNYGYYELKEATESAIEFIINNSIE